jgi:glyoxylase-like metal-dependent hydrolase (beta-lactamase superfamily II)
MSPIMDYRIISIGALSHHELWHEAAPVRTAHATTTLVRSGDRVILIDPGLPAPAIAARLTERTGLTPSAVTDVFLTNFRPAHRAGLSAFPQARWWISEREREAIGRLLIEHFQAEQEDDARVHLQQEITLLQKVQAAPDQLAPQVDLFPLPGFTPGTCGLILAHVRSTTLIAGDAVASIEHLEQGRVLRGAFDVELAQESFQEAVEIADVIVPGHDNVILNPIRQR